MFFSQAKLDKSVVDSTAFDSNGFYVSAGQQDSRVFSQKQSNATEEQALMGLVDKRDLTTKARNVEKANRVKAVAGGPGNEQVSDVQETYMWRKMETAAVPGVAPPQPRSGHTAFTLGSNDPRIFFHGGAADSVYFNDIYCLNTERRQWMLAHTYNKPKERAYHSITLAAPDPDLPARMQIPRVLMYGGFMKGALFDDMSIIDEWGPINAGKNGINEVLVPPKRIKDEAGPNQSRDVWAKQDASGEAPLPRCMHTATLVGGRHLVIIGGWNSRFVNDVYVLDTVTMYWEYKPAELVTTKTVKEGEEEEEDEEEVKRKNKDKKIMKIRPRAGHSATLLPRRRIFVFGGQNKQGQIDEPLLLDLNKMEWSRPIIDGKPPSRRSGHSACFDGTGKVFIYGGWDGTYQLDDLHVLNCQATDPNKWYWMVVDVTGYKIGGLCGHTATFITDRMFVFGGWSNAVFHNQVYVLDTSQLGKFKQLAGDFRNAAKAGKVGMAASVAAARRAIEEENAQKVQMEENYIENFKKLKQTAMETQNQLYSEDLSGEQLQAIHKKLEQELQSAHNLIEARKVLAQAADAEKERQAQRRANQVSTDVRRAQLKAALESGQTMKEAINHVDEPEQVMERKKQAQQILAQEGFHVQGLIGPSSLPAIEDISRQMSPSPIPAPPPPQTPDLTVYERDQIMNADSAFHQMVAGNPELQLEGDPLGMIEATGGLASCYHEEKRGKILDALEERASIKAGKGGALALSLNTGWESKTTYADVINHGRPAGQEIVPKSTVRPLRHIRPKPEVGELEDIRDGFVPEQPQQLEYNAMGYLLPAVEGDEGADPDEGGGMKVVPFIHPAEADTELALRMSKSSIPSFQAISLTEHYDREYTMPEGIQNSITMMQGAIRGFVARKNQREIRAAMTIQSMFKGWKQRKKRQETIAKAQAMNKRVGMALRMAKEVTTRVADDDVKLPPGILPPL